VKSRKFVAIEELLAAHRATFCSNRRMSGNRNFPARYAQPNVAATRLAATDFIIYNFTEITITTPPLTRILDRLIRGGISLYSDGV
jgi:hypothetical protein